MNSRNVKNGANQAADLIRAKLNSLYASEPNARQELQEAEANPHRSKHQQFMYDLSRSGKSLADIQVEWHNYYAKLPDQEKHRVWHEFYAEHNRQRAVKQIASQVVKPEQQGPQTVGNLQNRIRKHVSHQARASKKQHLQSLMFGLAAGSVAVVLLLFGFFNERFIAPFVTPSKTVSNTEIIIDPNDTSVGPEPKIIIPKINVEIPVVYDEPSIAEDDVQKALEDGVLHYATTSSPGEQGNTVIFGHSSNNIFNSGKYKFAFVLLKNLQEGDTFMLHKDGVRYVYRVFHKEVVKPTDTSVLANVKGKTAVATLITCDPPGTTINRLVVQAEQITPDPAKNTQSSAIVAEAEPEILPSNSPTLWSRLITWLSS